MEGRTYLEVMSTFVTSARRRFLSSSSGLSERLHRNNLQTPGTAVTPASLPVGFHAL